jgi:hypothetical protein
MPERGVAPAVGGHASAGVKWPSPWSELKIGKEGVDGVQCVWREAQGQGHAGAYVYGTSRRTLTANQSSLNSTHLSKYALKLMEG